MLYSRPQLRLLLLMAASLLLGLAVREWRAGFPDLAERLERFDREEPATPLPPVPLRDPTPSRRGPAPGTSGAGGGEARPAPAATPHMRPVTSRPRPAATTEPAADPADPRPLDLNSASLEQIARLPGVGPGLARRILEERERRGRFDSPDALRGVLGLGPKKMAALRDLVSATVD